MKKKTAKTAKTANKQYNENKIDDDVRLKTSKKSPPNNKKKQLTRKVTRTKSQRQTTSKSKRQLQKQSKRQSKNQSNTKQNKNQMKQISPNKSNKLKRIKQSKKSNNKSKSQKMKSVQTNDPNQTISNQENSFGRNQKQSNQNNKIPKSINLKKNPNANIFEIQHVFEDNIYKVKKIEYKKVNEMILLESENMNETNDYLRESSANLPSKINQIYSNNVNNTQFKQKKKQQD